VNIGEELTFNDDFEGGIDADASFHDISLARDWERGTSTEKSSGLGFYQPLTL